MAGVSVIFVHGWSVTSVDTYGQLPIRLRLEAEQQGHSINLTEIYLGKYISFHDEVRVRDISRAFHAAITEHLSNSITNGDRFICITHSTGGPVIRDWWHRYYPSTQKTTCPMSHLIMLAPANFGSALAQIGKARIGRLKSWFEGVEPGQGVLDWLELGSFEAWNLNKAWIGSDGSAIGPNGVFPFVLTGEYIDRKIYDTLNTYTGESGSDGVVRVASANLEGRYIQLSQPAPEKTSSNKLITKDFEITDFSDAPKTPLRIVTNKSHSGEKMGILRSVKRNVAEDESSELIEAIQNCINVKSQADYDALYEQFESETAIVQEFEQVETEDRLLFKPRYFIHDKYTMVIFRVTDHEGHAVTDYDLLITAGEDSDPNHLPAGFFVDRQRNRVNPEIITYFLNFDVIHGTEAVIDSNGTEIRPALTGIHSLGLEIRPRPEDGFVRYLPCRIKATQDLFEKALKANCTTLIDIVLQRIVYTEVFELELLGDKMPSGKKASFKDVEPGNDIAE